MEIPESAGKEQKRQTPKGRFLPGQSGNPAGRPPGTRNRATTLAQELLDGEAQALARVAVDLALGGDLEALRLCLSRIVPPVRERAIEIELPKVETLADLPGAISGLLQRVAAGELAPAEGERIAGLLGTWREAVEVAELEKRIAALEAK